MSSSPSYAVHYSASMSINDGLKKLEFDSPLPSEAGPTSRADHTRPSSLTVMNASNGRQRASIIQSGQLTRQLAARPEWFDAKPVLFPL